jgi:signal transduction histidine kinase
LVDVSSTEATSDIGSRNVVVLQTVTAGMFAIASIRFLNRADAMRDTFYGALAITSVFWALARINYVLTPSSLATRLTIGDWFRLMAYAVAVLGAASEFIGYWRRARDTAVLEERRRIARDLHDGLAQELAFITTQAKSLSMSVSDERATLLSRSSERALHESRRAIAALTHPVDEPLEVALTQQAEELSGRLGVRVRLHLEPVGRVSAETREALLRIAREAITNAGVHARPTQITVSLSNHDGINLLVSDNGKGFAPDDPRFYTGGRFGVTSMRERAAALGGTLRLQSRLYGGTKVELHLP